LDEHGFGNEELFPMTRFAFVCALAAPALIGISGCALNPMEIEPYREVSCFQAAKVSLKDAVEAAERNGGNAIEADYIQDKEMGCVQGEPGYYEVTLLSGPKLTTVSVDARSKLVGTPVAEPTTRGLLNGDILERLFEPSPASRAGIVPKVSITLLEAIAVAEKGGGKAMEADIAMNDAKPGYTIKLVEKGKLHTTWVDGAKGA